MEEEEKQEERCKAVFVEEEVELPPSLAEQIREELAPVLASALGL